MSNISQRIDVFAELGRFLEQFQTTSAANHHLNNTFLQPMKRALARSKAENGWFTDDSLRRALAIWGRELNPIALQKWVDRYDFTEPLEPRTIAVVMAGNIPLVGFHDFLTVLLFGHRVQAKLSSDDKSLLPVIAEMLTELHPEFQERISFVNRIDRPDAVIATGSDNTARYFAYYFGKYPNIIRKNRTSVAIITGREREEQLQDLGADLFTYYGLGCRNVSKLYVPLDYDLNRIFGAIVGYADITQNHKYANNYAYHRAIFMLNKEPFLENGFVIFREHEALHTPISVIHYERYEDERALRTKLGEIREEIQCVVGGSDGDVPFGQTQAPALWDYADGVDTVAFLNKLK
jgi:hypothetical protein